MRRKSIPLRPSRFALEASKSLPEKEVGYGAVPQACDERDVPHKERSIDVGTSETGNGGCESCIICGFLDMSVIRCSGMDCPLCFHEECLTPEYGGNEDLSNPFCPYCWYKYVLKRSEKLKEMAIEAEKGVSVFLGKEVKGSDEVTEGIPERQEGMALSGEKDLQGEKAADLSKEEQEKDQGKLEVGSGEARDMEVENVNEEVEATEKEERVVTEQDDEADKRAEVQTKVGACAVSKVDVSLLLAMQESSSEGEEEQDQQNEKRRRRRVMKGKSRDKEEDEVMEDVEATVNEEIIATQNLQDDEDDGETAGDQTRVNTGAGKKGHNQVQQNEKQNLQDAEDDEETAGDQTRVNTGAGEKGHNQVQQNEKQRRRRLMKGKSRDMEDEVLEDDEALEDEEMTATESLQGNGDGKDTAGDQTKVDTDAGEKVHNQVQQSEKRRRRRLVKLSDLDDEESSSKERKEEDVTEEISSSSSGQTKNQQGKLNAATKAAASSSSGQMNNQQSKLNAATKAAASSNPVRKLPSWDASFFNKNQRRRLLWTYEEEQMLKAGVLKFAPEANKNMPWRKILEMGANVFHESRTPSDLKDKFRNMLKAETQH